jgi:hypothetical protein
MRDVSSLKVDTYVRGLKDIIEAAEASNYEGLRALLKAHNAGQMLMTLKLIAPELRGLAKFGHIHESLLKRVENSISLAERGSEIHKENPNGTYQQPSNEGDSQSHVRNA